MTRFTPEMAEAISRSLENNVKLVQFFERYDKENKKLQEETERGLEEIVDNLNDPSVSAFDYGLTLTLMYKALRATKRARHRNLRTRMMMLINLVKRFQLMDEDVVTKTAIKKLVQLFINIYTFMIDDHVRNTTALEDSIIFAVKTGSSETAMAWNDTMSNVVDTENTKEQLLNEVGDGAMQDTDDNLLEGMDTRGLF